MHASHSVLVSEIMLGFHMRISYPESQQKYQGYMHLHITQAKFRIYCEIIL